MPPFVAQGEVSILLQTMDDFPKGAVARPPEDDHHGHGHDGHHGHGHEHVSHDHRTDAGAAATPVVTVDPQANVTADEPTPAAPASLEVESTVSKV